MRIGTLAVLLALGALPAVAAPTKQPASPFATDKRLDKKVTLQSRRMFVGELLERVRAETHVPLTTDDHLAPISGYEIVVSVHDRAARDLLNAVASLYNAAPDRWFWERDSRTRGYILRNTLSIAALQAFRAQLEEDAFISQIQRQRAEDASEPGASTTNRGLVLLQGLAPDQLREILRGKDLALPVSSLNSRQRAVLAGALAQTNAQRRELAEKNGAAAALPELQLDDQSNLVIHRDPKAGYLPMIFAKTGELYMLVGGFLGLVREMEKGQTAWREGDQAQPPDPPTTADSDKFPPEKLRVGYTTMDGVVDLLGRAREVDLLYDRPMGRASGFWINSEKGGINLTAPMPELLEQLGRQNLMWKYRDPFILFRIKDWTGNPRDGAVPWPVVKQLRKSADANDGLLTPFDLLTLAELTTPQRQGIAWEFPDASGIERALSPKLIAPLRLAAAMNDTERLAAAHPDGSSWGEWSRRTRKRAIELFGREGARQTRVHLEWVMGAHPELRYGFASSPDAPMHSERMMLQRRRPDGRPPGVPASAPWPPVPR